MLGNFYQKIEVINLQPEKDDYSKEAL